VVDSAAGVVAGAEVAGLVGVAVAASTAVVVAEVVVAEVASTAEQVVVFRGEGAHDRVGVRPRSAILRVAVRVRQRGPIRAGVAGLLRIPVVPDLKPVRDLARECNPVPVRVWAVKDYSPVLVPEPGSLRGTGRRPFRELDPGPARVLEPVLARGRALARAPALVREPGCVPVSGRGLPRFRG
jgi:hypothetical protein